MDKRQKLILYFDEEHQYKTAINLLRDLILKTELEETYKWNFPTYTLGGKNVLAICKFKFHFGIWFFNGVFLSDPLKVLENAQEGKTQAMRHWKFSTIDEIVPLKITAYIKEAIENEKKGIRLSCKPKTNKDKIVIPNLLKKAIEEDTALKSAFYKLTDSKKREYASYISLAIQEKTKASRLEKIKTLILNSKGLSL